MNNLNIKEEASKAYSHHPMYNSHQKLLSQQSAEELHTALKSCHELGHAKNLEQFMQDLQKITDSQVPNEKDIKVIKQDQSLKKFLRTVVVCTE